MDDDMIEYNATCSPAQKAICHLVGLLNDMDGEVNIWNDSGNNVVIAEVRPAGKIRWELPSKIYDGISNVIKVEIGKVPMNYQCEITGVIKVMDQTGDIRDIMATISSSGGSISLVRMTKSAQQVDSAEAATND